MVLVAQLPAESATSTAIRNNATEDEMSERRGDPKQAPWSSTDRLLIQLIDEMRVANWMYASAHSKGKVPKPEPFLGGGQSTRRRIKTAEELKAIDPRLRSLPDDDAVSRYMEMTGRD